MECETFVLGKYSTTKVILSGEVSFKDVQQRAKVCLFVCGTHARTHARTHTHTLLYCQQLSHSHDHFLPNKCNVFAFAQNMSLSNVFSGQTQNVIWNSFIEVTYDKQRYVQESSKQSVKGFIH